MKINSLNARIFSRLGHRGSFAMALMELGENMENLMVMVADLATLTGLERFKNTYPDKFMNMGIAEQNMIGVAAGMAKDGFTVFITTYANFLSMRSYEQIRLHLGYMGFNVKVIGTGSGVAMGMSGNTHYGIEDIALMRAVPGLTVLSPADGVEIVKTIEAVSKFNAPVYVRLTGVMNNPIVYKDDYNFEIGKAITLRQGSDITIIATGSMVYEALEAAKLLDDRSISASVVNMHTVKPLDTSAIQEACESSNLIVTVEEHSVIGGLGGAVAEYKATLKESPPQIFIGLPDKFDEVGEYRYLLEKHGLTAKLIADRIESEYKRYLSCS